MNISKKLKLMVVITFCLLTISACKTNPFTVNLNPNTGNVKGAIITLTNNDGNKAHIYKRTAKDTAVIFKKVVPGVYTLTVEHDDFFPLTDKEVSVNIITKNYTANIIKNGPATIKISAQGFSPANGAIVKIINRDGKTKSEILQGDSLVFNRLVPGILTIEITHDQYATFTQQNYPALQLLNGLSVIIYDKKIAVGQRGLGGGYVFYDKGDFADGWRYKEAAPANTEFGDNWDSAIERCKELDISGFTDWTFPNREQLDWIYQNLHISGIGGFQNAAYWSSNQNFSVENTAWGQDFANGNPCIYGNCNANRVRVIRAF